MMLLSATQSLTYIQDINHEHLAGDGVLGDSLQQSDPV